MTNQTNSETKQVNKISINEIFKLAVRLDASDILIKVGSPPVFRINGKLLDLKKVPPVNSSESVEYANTVMNDWQKNKFNENFEMDLTYKLDGNYVSVKSEHIESNITYDIPEARFRVNIFKQRGSISIVARVIKNEISNFDQLNLPPVMESIAKEERGLVVVTGTTGSGKSTTLASIIDHINSNSKKHIITIEDPIEYVYKDKLSYINQREVGVDTRSFNGALRSALREDPDVILIGEMRDLETIELCLTAAETGHLVLATLHALDSRETINRILGVFPIDQQNAVRHQFCNTLKAIISQRLVPCADGKSRVPAVEILLCTSRIRALLSSPETTGSINDAIAEGKDHYGMQTFDQCLLDFHNKKLITYEETMKQATNKEDLDLKIRGVGN